MSRFDELAAKAKEVSGMELFKDKVRLGQGIFLWHLRTDAGALAAQHFKTLDEVEEYLNACGE